MESLNLFPDPDVNGPTNPTDIGCVWPGCGKIRAPNSPHCPHHVVLTEWAKGEAARRKRRAELLKKQRRLEDEKLATLNPQFEPPPKKRGAKPTSSVNGHLRSARMPKFEIEKRIS